MFGNEIKRIYWKIFHLRLFKNCFQKCIIWYYISTCRNNVWTHLLREFYCPTDTSTEIFHWVQICPVCYTTMTTRSRGKQIRDKSKGLFEGRGILDQLVSVVEIGAKKLVAFMWLSQSVPHSFLMAFFSFCISFALLKTTFPVFEVSQILFCQFFFHTTKKECRLNQLQLPN